MVNNSMAKPGDRSADKAAVGKVLLTLGAAFRELDAPAAAPLYAEDADWVNAFGVSQHGRQAIAVYLGGA